MSDVYSYSWLILVAPFIAFLVNSLWLGKKNWKAAAGLSTFAMAGSAVYSIKIAFDFFTQLPAQKHIIAWQYNWLEFNDTLTAKIGCLLDPISVMMLVVITVIATMVNIYSIGYMKDDPSAGRFFGTLSLFCFSMLGLVVATNLIQIYVFWELVGVSSYLLIGFWYTKPSAVAASKKAFIVTRFADAFFLLGIIITGYVLKTFDFIDINSLQAADSMNHIVSVGFLTVNVLTVSTILIFIGGWGKSAMFPLHIWLPDAMEGPTPVSSIIHSATMVVAGIFLTARLFTIFSFSFVTLDIIAAVGCFTALFAAVIACTQSDIKRILAFSTLSQLGYMMFSLGVTHDISGDEGINILGFQASMFHVFTHAFFKCMLFLMAGAVIHAVHTNDIWKMGGLRKKMPFTYWSTLAACLAIGGIPPLSGFWSKDEILLASFLSGHNIIGSIGLIVGGLTAFYMFRLFFVTFHGELKESGQHAHEDKWMTTPIVLLAIPTIGIGWIAKSYFLGSFTPLGHIAQIESPHHLTWLPIVASIMGVSGLIIAWVLYGKGNYKTATALSEKFGKSYTVIKNKFYIDEIYLHITHKIIFDKVAAPIKWFDSNIVDGFMNFVGWVLHLFGKLVRFSQNGQIQLYIGTMFLGFFLIYFIYKVAA
ncbi:MAG: NADH-quinone oxidoreductase subunit L [Planctomycetota bacterium]|nr:MAG: NADH-quinone oxidoreductase subunit L [Planctomycetota bacterium]